MNRLNPVPVTRHADLTISSPSHSKTTDGKGLSPAQEEQAFRQIARNPIPQGFFTMLCNAKKLSSR